jgi:large subunit ribosomal protein L19
MSKDLKVATQKEIELPDFRSGDTVKVFYKIVEGEKTRVQPFEGIVIARKGTQATKTFTVRKIGADSIGVERIFPLFSPNLEKIELLKKGNVRRSKLYYMRAKKGKEASRVKELRDKPVSSKAAEVLESPSEQVQTPSEE